MNRPHILVIEDDLDIHQLVEAALEKASFKVIGALTIAEGWHHLEQYKPDLVIIDILMPDGDGVALVRQIRQKFTTQPLMIFSGLTSDRDIERGLAAGADDYLTKPLSTKLLRARVNALMRRSAMPAVAGDIPQDYTDDYLSIDLVNHEVTIQAQPVHLTPTEYELLAFLVRNANHLLTYEQILINVWGWRNESETNEIQVFISQLRKKIEQEPKSPEYILTEWGKGYRFRTKSLHLL